MRSVSLRSIPDEIAILFAACAPAIMVQSPIFFDVPNASFKGSFGDRLRNPETGRGKGVSLIWHLIVGHRSDSCLA
jgi:hypothetical protein